MHTTPNFPAPGSMADYEGQPARIHQWNADGSALIFLADRACRVEPDALRPLPDTDPFVRWVADRVGARGRGCFTPLDDIYLDFTRWCDEAGLSDFRIQSRLAFGRVCVAHGFVSDKQSVRSGFATFGFAAARVVSGLRIELRPIPPTEAPARKRAAA